MPVFLKNYIKDPQAVLDYILDWNIKYLQAGETIVTSTWIVPAGLTEPQASSHAGGLTTVWLGGGTVDTDYAVTNHITTSAGRTDDRSILIRVQER
jgi:hypothetical protein